MKVGIITFHFVSNQGGVLQAFASQSFLEKHGYEAFIINYRPKYHTIRYLPHKNPYIYTKWYWKKNKGVNILKRILLTLLSFARCVWMNLKQSDTRKYYLFEKFITNHLHQTREYENLSQLKNNPPQLDAYVSGSDQLWNPDLLNFAFDPAYFLAFGPNEIPKIAYAVSSGKKLTPKEESQLQSLCRNFSAISLREYNESTVKAIGRDVHICIDPTLLLDAEDYKLVEGNCQEKEPYIFVYGFETNNDIQEAVNKAVAMLGCKVINGSPDRINLKNECKKLHDYDPGMFLSLVKNAECVVTNSFHGTAFSLIYQKPFITVPHTTRGQRMTELLGKLNLGYKIYGNQDFDINKEIDWGEVYKKLNELRKQSSDFLLNSLKYLNK